MDEQKFISAEIILTGNEPIKITGTFEIKSYDGKLLSSEFENEVFLCACGRSKTKPFCDGSHKG